MLWRLFLPDVHAKQPSSGFVPGGGGGGGFKWRRQVNTMYNKISPSRPFQLQERVMLQRHKKPTLQMIELDQVSVVMLVFLERAAAAAAAVAAAASEFPQVGVHWQHELALIEIRDAERTNLRTEAANDITLHLIT